MIYFLDGMGEAFGRLAVEQQPPYPNFDLATFIDSLISLLSECFFFGTCIVTTTIALGGRSFSTDTVKPENLIRSLLRPYPQAAQRTSLRSILLLMRSLRFSPDHLLPLKRSIIKGLSGS